MFGLSICLVYYAKASLSVVFKHWMAVVFWLIIDLASYVKTSTSWAGTFPVKVFLVIIGFSAVLDLLLHYISFLLISRCVFPFQR